MGKMDSTFGQPQWSWGDAMDSHETEATSSSADTGAARATGAYSRTYRIPKQEQEQEHEQETEHEQEYEHGQQREQPRPRERRRRYRPRTCRICLDVVEPKIEIEESATGMFAAKQRVRYVSDDPELGRLISPCKCKGSQKYVHEGCLQAWRMSAPMSDRNYWKCPTCHFQYRMQRLSWGRWLSSKFARVIATCLILVMAIFLLGFVADPIINLWIDPIGLVTDTLTDIVTDIEALRVVDDLEPSTWSYHFLKGLFSLGLLGFAKSFLAMSPWQWFNVRWGIRRGNGRRGQDRLDNISWSLVFIGVLTFLAVRSTPRETDLSDAAVLDTD